VRPTLRILRLLLPLLLCDPALAQEPRLLPYATTITTDPGPAGAAALDAPLAAASLLRRLAAEAAVDADGLVARALAEPRLLDEVLRAEGFWGGRAEVSLDGEAADAPGLAERLAARQPADRAVAVAVRVISGPLYRLRRLALRPAPQAEGSDAILALGAPAALAAGDPARAGAVLDAEAALVDRLRDAGHPLAVIAEREVVVDHEAQAMDVTWTIAAGPAARFAAPEITGETAVSPLLLGRIARHLDGAPYAPATLERMRRDLLGLGAFDTVRVRAAQRLDAAGRLPVTFAVADRPRNAAGFNLAYETNYGPSGQVFYERRNLFGNAERLRLEATVSRLDAAGRTADVNSRLGANLRRPGLVDGRTTAVADLAAVRERLAAYDRDAVVAALLLERPFGDRWVLQSGPSFETGRIGRDGELARFTLAGWVLGARYDGTDALLDPRRGFRLSASVTPYADLAEGGGFLRAIGTARSYVDLGGDGGSVIALRGTIGSLLGADQAVPLDKRFHAGGGGSVRGYGYQRIGPRDARNRPNGGSSLVEGSVELRQRLSGPIGMVAFVDAGSVGARDAPDFSEVRLGAGLGIRYATAIGPLRLDVAVPVQQQQGDAGFGIYVGLGQAF
jgi:translocation and assembly module TamA